MNGSRDSFDFSEPDPRAKPEPRSPRSSIQVWFECAGVYQRVFRTVLGDGASFYLARCSKCGKTMRFEVGPEGTQQRTFRVSC
ncbi:MAG: hypothetical protein ACK54H_02070 [Phycisphaerales bacterium]